MRQIALDVVKTLKLNYELTLISNGESRKCEIVVWDKPRNCYFSIHLRWTEGESAETLATEIEGQLRQRLTTLNSGANSDFGERSPDRPDRAHA